MIEFILMEKHELQVDQIADMREILKIVFGQIEFDQIGTSPQRGYFECERGMKNE